MQTRTGPADHGSFSGSSPVAPSGLSDGDGVASVPAGGVAGVPAGGFDGGTGAVATAPAVFPPGWAPCEEALTEDELWELRFGDGGADLSVAQLDALLARLPAGALDDPEIDGAGDPPGVAGMVGLMPRDMPAGGGFDAGGVADKLPPGPVLAALTERTRDAGLHRLNDDELIGLVLGWRRLHSWATAGELAAVAALARRRDRQAIAAGDPGIAEHFGDELAVAMTLTGRSAAGLLDFATALATLPGTRGALAAGVIDRAKAYVIADELAGLGRVEAARVEAQLLAAAERQTTGQLRAAAKRAVLKTDPTAAKKRREAAGRGARVEVWHEPAGTASLAGRDLPPADVLAADQRINALARHLQATGHPGTLDQLRAHAYTTLLLGHPTGDPTTPAPASTTPQQDGPAAPRSRAGSTPHADPATAPGPSTTTTPASDHQHPGTGGSAGPPEQAPAQPGGLRGSVNLTLPLATLLGTADSPGDLAGLGPIPASDARTLAHQLASPPGNRWCLTLTGPHGHAIAHGCTTTNARNSATPTGKTTSTRASSGSTGPPGLLTITVTPLATGTCDHQRQTPGYHPTPALRHALHIRQRTCSAPGCRRQATACDLDHTVPYARGGRTCECGLAPLCRRHHRAKQTHGWKLEQPHPGTLIWRLPHGRTYHVEPGPYLE